MHQQAVGSIRHVEHKLCSLTKRAMIISPVPERIQSMALKLNSECFDIIMLHEVDLSLISPLRPDLIIFDGMSYMDGEQCIQPLVKDEKRIRQIDQHQIPLLLLIDSNSEQHRELEHSLSSAQCIVWQSSLDEMIDLIQERLLQSATLVSYQDRLIYKDLSIDLKRMIVIREQQRIELTKTEYDLLLHFLNSDGSVQSRELLLNEIWGLQFFAGSNVVDVHIKSLRKKLHDNVVDPKYIVTVRGVGYRLADLD